MTGDNVKYFDSFEVEYVPKEIKKVIGNQTIITNIYRIQANHSIMCGCFCTGFFHFLLEGESLSEMYHIVFSSRI